jgi:hypothetical protein
MLDTTLNTLWVDGSLGYIEQVCLTSALSVGHKVRLYTYEEVKNIPDGIEVQDANKILPKQHMIQYRKNSSYALGADIFRYELLRLGKGIWVDADVYFIKPIQFDCDVLFGWEDSKYINNAILYFAPNANILKQLQSFINSDPVVPPWWSKEDQEEQQILYLNGQHKTLENLPWATTGPKAITYFARLLDLDKFAKPPQVFYPVHWTKAERLFDPNFFYTSAISEDTLAIHIWNHLIEKLKRNTPPAGSFIYDICKKHNILME